MDKRLILIKGDITLQQVDAIVNAANTSLLGGGGVDGAIHRAAGPTLLEECRTLGGCPTGEARLTRGYNLPARWVIHTVGPVWVDGTQGERDLLARCYRSCLGIATSMGLRSVAFPSISTGAYGFPVEEASKIAVREILDFLRKNPAFESVVVVCFDQLTHACYTSAVRSQVSGCQPSPTESQETGGRPL